MSESVDESNTVTETREAPAPSLESTPYQRLKPLDPETRASVKADITENGVREPIKVDEEGRIIDGHHRVEICEELGIGADEIPVEVVANLTEAEKIDLAYKSNLQRRNLDKGSKQALVEQYLAEDWDGDNSGGWREEKAQTLGVSRSTVSRAFTRLKASGKLSHLGIFSDGDKRRQVREYLQENPDASNRDVADAIEADVSHATVGNWQREWKEKREQRESDVHGEDVAKDEDELEPESEAESELIDVPKVANPDTETGVGPADPVDLNVPSHHDGETGDAADEQVIRRPYTESTVVNIDDLDMTPHEVQKSDNHEWIGSEDGKNITNTLVGDPGWLGNPHKRQEMHLECARTAYRVHFEDALEEARFRRDVEALEDNTLVCSCAPSPCHGEVILEYLDEQARKAELEPLTDALEDIDGVGEKTIETVHEEIGDLEADAVANPAHVDRMNVGIGLELAEEIIEATGSATDLEDENR